MATEDHDLDSEDFEDFDIPEFDDSDLFDTPEDRKPIDRVKTGFLSGVKRAATNRETYRTIVSSLLPRGYASAFDDAAAAYDTGRDLYDTASRNLAPAKESIKRLARKASEKLDGRVPQSLLDKIQELTEPAKVDEIDTYRPPTLAELRQTEIATTLAEIFGEEAKHHAQERLDDAERDEAREALEWGRHAENLKQSASLRNSVDRLVAYQDNITARYQKRSLELRYKQLFVAKDHLTLFQAYTKDIDAHLKAIAKNTALPELTKIRMSESAGKMLKDKALSGIGNTLSGYTGGFLSNIRDNVKRQVDMSTRALSGGIRAASSGVDMMEMAGSMGGGPDFLEMGGELGTEFAIESGLPSLLYRLGSRIGQNNRVKNVGDRLEYMSENRGELLRDRIDNLRTADDTTLTGKAKGVLGRYAYNMLPRYSAEATFGQDPMNLANEATTFSKLTDKSITEIIPGLLSDILQEAEMIRTGSDDVDRRIFDHSSGRIERQSTVTDTLSKRLLDDSTSRVLTDSLKGIMKAVDPDKKLSEESREAFRRQVTADALNGRGFNPERYLSDRGLNTVSNELLRAEIQKHIAETFYNEDGDFVASESNIAARSAAGRFAKYMQRDLPNHKEVLTQLRSIYGSQVMKDTGMMKSYGMGVDQFDSDRFIDRILNPSSSRGQVNDRQVNRPTFGPQSPSDRPLHRSDTDFDSAAGRDDIHRIIRVMEANISASSDVDNYNALKEIQKTLIKIDSNPNLLVSNQWLEKIEHHLNKNSDTLPPGATPVAMSMKIPFRRRSGTVEERLSDRIDTRPSSKMDAYRAETIRLKEALMSNKSALPDEEEIYTSMDDAVEDIPKQETPRKRSSILGQMGRGIGSAYMGYGKGLGKLAGGMGSLAASPFHAIANKISGRSKKGGMDLKPLLDATYEQMDLLYNIYNLLDNRLEEPERIRKGSWQDMNNSESKDEALAAAIDKGDPRIADPSNNLFGMFSGLKDRIGGFFGGDGGIGLGDAAVAGDLLMNRGGKKPATRRAGKGSRLGRAARGAGRLAAGAGRMALPMLAGGAKVAAVGGAKLGAGALAAAGAVVSAPVLLTAGAVAAVGIGGYMAYKHLFKKVKGGLHEIRMNQYGINVGNEDHMALIGGLEAELEKSVKHTSEGASLGSSVDVEALLEGFNVNFEDQDHIERWLSWFQERFKPVFLTHATVAHKVAGKSVTEIDDKLSNTKQLEYLTKVKFEGDNVPYDHMTSPFHDGARLMSKRNVRSAISRFERALKSAIKKDEKNGVVDEPDSSNSVIASMPTLSDEALNERDDDVSGAGDYDDESSMVDKPKTMSSNVVNYDDDGLERQTRSESDARSRQQRVVESQKMSVVNNINDRMGDMLTVLGKSYQVQSNIDKRLAELNTFIRAQLEEDIDASQVLDDMNKASKNVDRSSTSSQKPPANVVVSMSR